MFRKLLALAIILLLFINTLMLIETNGNYSFNENKNSISEKKINKYNEKNINVIISQNNFFTENKGQLKNDEVRFYDQNSPIWFTDDGVYFHLDEKISNDRIQIKHSFINANQIIPEGNEFSGWHFNFFYGNDPSKWYSNVPNYKEICYNNLYEGIDLIYYIKEHQLKYDFIVHPGADVRQIKLKYEGVQQLEIDAFGDLIINIGSTKIKDTGLYVYQDLRNERRDLKANFVLYDDLEYGFEINDNYDPDEIIIIDPTIEYSTFIGGTAAERGHKIIVDDSGNTYVTGYTVSTDFPTTPEANDTSHNGGSSGDELKDVFVTKLNSIGSSPIYSTYIGGDNKDVGFDIDIDTNGNAFVTGETKSSNFPITSGANDTDLNGTVDSFAFKLNHNGSLLLYSTYIGGISSDYGYGIVVNSQGNAIVTGTTSSSDFVTTPDAYDTVLDGQNVFVSNLNNDGSGFIYSTFVGGTAMDIGEDIAIDTSDNAYVTGYTLSSDFPTSQNAYDKSLSNIRDIFLFKLNWDGSQLLYSTFLGGSFSVHEYGYAVAVDSNGNAYVTGRTRCNDFPVIQGSYDDTYNGHASSTEGGDCFVTKFDKNGSNILYSTYIGGSNDERGQDITIDCVGNAYVVGYTDSTDFPRSSNTLYNSYMGGNFDAFICRLNPNGTKLIFSSYLGGSSTDYGFGISLQSKGIIYITGSTSSSNFPTTPGAFNRTQFSSEVFVLKLDFQAIFNITFLDFLLNGNPQTIAYSALGPYTISVKARNTLFINDIKSIQIIIDPSNANAKLTWQRISGEFSEVSDPNDYVTLDPSSNAFNDGEDNWTVNFNITFAWSYPHENLNEIRIYSESNVFPPIWHNSTGLFKVENDLNLTGILTVKTGTDQVVTQNDIIKGGGTLKWSGLIAVYEGTIDIFPFDEDFNITVWDEQKNHWSSSPATGSPFYIETTTKPVTNEAGETFTINITDISPGNDASNVSFLIRFDNNNVSFSNAKPAEDVWQTDSDVKVSINITDSGGSFVDGSSVKIAVSNDNGTTWSDWNTVYDINNDLEILAEETIKLDDGMNNLIKWEAKDTLGNGPKESDIHRILVDTEDVIFYNAWPAEDEVSSKEIVQVGISISDTTSGVDASSIEYSISTDKGKIWSEWKEVEGYDNGNLISAEIELTLPNGTNNLIKWRAKDIAGNGPKISNSSIIKINTMISQQKIIPRAILISPPNNLKINNTKVKLIWTLENTSMIGVTYDLYLQNQTPPGLYQSGIIETSYMLEELNRGETYYWKIIPSLDGETGVCLSGIWSFEIESYSSSDVDYKVEINGPFNISLHQGENTSFDLTITNLGIKSDLITLELNTDNLPRNYFIFDTSSLSLPPKSSEKRPISIIIPLNAQPNNYKINITAKSTYSDSDVFDHHTITLEILEKDIDGDSSGDKKDAAGDKYGILLIVLSIIIIIVIVVIILFFIMKRKKAMQDEEQRKGLEEETSKEYDVLATEKEELSSAFVEAEQITPLSQDDKLEAGSDIYKEQKEIKPIPVVAVPIPQTPIAQAQPQTQLPQQDTTIIGLPSPTEPLQSQEDNASNHAEKDEEQKENL